MAQAHPILEKSGFNPDKKLKIVGTSPVKHDGLDKVTGRAKFGADMFLPGMLVGKILRCPHAHAIIKSIDISAAEKLPGVKAVICRDDFPEIKAGTADGDMTRNAMAREKALYDGHPVAAVAATSKSIAKAALKLIKVEYELLPHVIDPVEAMKPDAPILHDHLRTKGVKGADKPTNVVERYELGIGDVEAGFDEADVIVEREFDTKPMHQGYIEPQACVASTTEDGQIELWCCTQAPWVYPRPPLQHPQDRDRKDPRAAVRDGRRLRRQDRLLSGADRDPALAQGQAAGEDHAHPQRGVPRHRSGVRHQIAHQDRLQEGRHHHRRGGRAVLPDRPLHRLGLHQRAAGDVHALCAEERQDHRPTRSSRTARR